MIIDIYIYFLEKGLKLFSTHGITLLSKNTLNRKYDTTTNFIYNIKFANLNNLGTEEFKYHILTVIINLFKIKQLTFAIFIKILNIVYI